MISYLDSISSVIREELHESSSDSTPAGLVRLYAVLLLAKGREVNADDVHNVWSAWMQLTEPDHRDIRPFDELDEQTKAADAPFVAAIRRAAVRLEDTAQDG